MYVVVGITDFWLLVGVFLILGGAILALALVLIVIGVYGLLDRLHERRAMK